MILTILNALKKNKIPCDFKFIPHESYVKLTVPMENIYIDNTLIKETVEPQVVQGEVYIDQNGKIKINIVEI